MQLFEYKNEINFLTEPLLCIMEIIESIIKDISYNPKNYTKASIDLKHNIKKALLVIPGYFENIRIIKALNMCLIQLQEIAGARNRKRI